MKNKEQSARVGDRVVFIGQAKTDGVIVEVTDNIEKSLKVHWGNPPTGNNIHRNGRGSYNISQLKIMRI